jgi:hypothetical protein
MRGDTVTPPVAIGNFGMLASASGTQGDPPKAITRVYSGSCRLPIFTKLSILMPLGWRGAVSWARGGRELVRWWSAIRFYVILLQSPLLMLNVEFLGLTIPDLTHE